ncbi:Uncharacterised protein [Mycobacterium tuberculosis]|nr:Uncharacterised protein [Mycobacterium tuberculosis]
MNSSLNFAASRPLAAAQAMMLASPFTFWRCAWIALNTFGWYSSTLPMASSV